MRATIRGLAAVLTLTSIASAATPEELELAAKVWHAMMARNAHITSGDVTVVLTHPSPNPDPNAAEPPPTVESLSGTFSLAPGGEERIRTMWCDEVEHYLIVKTNLPSRLRAFASDPVTFNDLENWRLCTPTRWEVYTNSAQGEIFTRLAAVEAPKGPYLQGVINDHVENCAGGDKGQYYWRMLIGVGNFREEQSLEHHLRMIANVWLGEHGFLYIYREVPSEVGTTRSVEVFDPSRGYAKVWAWQEAAGGHNEAWTVHSGHRVIDGVWVAERIDTTFRARWSNGWVRSSLLLESIKLNRPEFCDPAQYAITYPAGTTVYDNRNNLRYIMHTPGTATDEAIDEAVQRNPGRRIVHMGLTGDALAAAQAQADRLAAEQAADLARRRAERDRERASAQPTAAASPLDGRLGIVIAGSIAAALAIACWAVARWMLKRNPST